MSETIQKLQKYLQTHRDRLKHKPIEDGEVFWVSQNTKMLFDLGDVFEEDGSLQSAIRTVGRVGGTVRVLLYDNDSAELRVADSFQEVMWDGNVD
jgi:hypothetical protein